MYICTLLIYRKTYSLILADRELDGGTLERFGRARLGRDPFPASAGLYLIDVTGAAGGIIRQGVIFKNIKGFNYSNEAAFTLTGATGPNNGPGFDPWTGRPANCRR